MGQRNHGGIDLADAWPAARRDLLTGLTARHVPRADAEDIVQEVAIRAIQHEERFATPDDLARWGWRVAWRLRIDAVRRNRRLTSGEFADVAGWDDTVRTVEGRITLESAMAGMTRLTATDRTALFEVPRAGAGRQETVRLAVRRHRARARLTQLTGGLAALGAWLRGLRPRLRPRTALAVLPVALLVALDLGFWLMPGPVPGATPGLSAWEAPLTRAPAPANAGAGGSPERGVSRTAVDRGAKGAGEDWTTIAVMPIQPSRRVRVSSSHPEDRKTACVDNVGPVHHACADRPDISDDDDLLKGLIPE